MKHIKHLFAVCLLLLVATTATAQSQSDNTQTKAASAAKADVNGDGVVNEADIEEIIEIMKKDNGVKYYWYVGQENPANLDESFNPEGVEGWTRFEKEKDYPIKISKQNADYSTNIWYIAAPYDWGYTLYNATGAASNEAGFNISTVTLGGVKYKVWTSKDARYQAVGQLIIK